MTKDLDDLCSSVIHSIAIRQSWNHSGSIYAVPERLKKSNENAYIPRVVSIGPLFKGTRSRENLFLMENIKLKCVEHLFSRVKVDSPDEILKECCKIIWYFDDKIRDSYGIDIEMDRSELTRTMLFDSCFLLELVISNELDDELPSRTNLSSPAFELLRDEDVLSDLTLLENQIPIFVLHSLCKTLFGNTFGNNTTEIATNINNCFLSILDYDKLGIQDIGARHILDVVYFFINGESERKRLSHRDQKQHHVVEINIDAQTQQPRVSKLKLKRCALRLLNAGVTIKAKLTMDEDSFHLWMLKCLLGLLIRFSRILLRNNISKHMDLIMSFMSRHAKAKGLNFNFKFEKGKLEIDQLHITRTTKAKWCNLIAWEHQRKYYSRLEAIYNEAGEDVSCHPNSGKFTWAALVFDGLICSTDDVQLLKDKKIVVDHLNMSNQDLMEFFRKIALGVDHGILDYHSHFQMVDDINNYSQGFFIKKIWRIILNSLRYRQEWIITFMNRGYNFVATMLFVFTLLQTVYTILGYYIPK